MKIFPTVNTFVRLLIASVGLIGARHPILAAETPPVALNTEPIVLDKMTVKAARERIDRYQTKVDDLFDGLRLEKKVRYATVILNSYDTSKFDLVETLIAKKKYRETTAKGHTFFCNYAAVNMDVPVYFEMYDPLRTGTLNGGAIGGSIYLFKKKKIQLRQGGDKTKIYPAAGAALSGFIAPENLGTVQELGKKRKDSEFVKEVNFEVRLQDLNRYHAMITDGRPIMNPLDSIRAIVSMGERLKKPMVQEILERNHVSFKPEDLDKVLSSAVYRKDGSDLPDSDGSHASAFSFAKRLVQGLLGTNSENLLGGGESRTTIDLETGLELLSGKDYENYLERILIEAPGHI